MYLSRLAEYDDVIIGVPFLVLLRAPPTSNHGCYVVSGLLFKWK